MRYFIKQAISEGRLATDMVTGSLADMRDKKNISRMKKFIAERAGNPVSGTSIAGYTALGAGVGAGLGAIPLLFKIPIKETVPLIALTGALGGLTGFAGRYMTKRRNEDAEYIKKHKFKAKDIQEYVKKHYGYGYGNY